MSAQSLRKKLSAFFPDSISRGVGQLCFSSTRLQERIKCGPGISPSLTFLSTMIFGALAEILETQSYKALNPKP